MRPREKQMFVIPACFISCFPLFFFIICYWKSWNEQKPTVITFNTYINYYSTFFLGDTFLHVRLTGVTFIKWTVYCILIPIDVSFYCTLSIEIYCTMVITFCLKHIKITRSVFYCSRRGCYWTWAKFWQRNCKAKQRMERRRLEYSCTFCIRFLQQSQNTCIHKNNSSSYAGYLIRGFIYWYLTEELKFIPNGG